MLPENVDFPVIRYFVVSYDDRSYREYGNPTERAKSRVQIDCYDKTSSGCTELGDAVMADFDGWTNGTAVGHSRVVNRFNSGWQDEISAYREIVDVMIDYKR